MSTIVFIHIITWSLIGLVGAYGLVSDQFQQVLISQYISRVLFIILVISGLLNVVHTVAMSPLLVWVQFILEITTIGMFDFAIAYKRNSQSIKRKMIIFLIFTFSITMILGEIIQFIYG